MKFEILVGMIASGKSTYTKKRAKEGAIIVNDDIIVNCVHGDIHTMYSRDLKPLYRGIESLIIHGAALAGRDIVIDRPNVKKETRQRYIEIAKSLDYCKIECVIFNMESPYTHAMRRTNSDCRGYDFGYWLNVANYHFNMYITPDIGDGYTGIFKFQENKTVPIDS